MKKIIIFICLLSLMFTFEAMSQGGGTLTIPTVQAPAAGGAVTMPIVVSNFTNVGAITLKITYDTSAVTYVGVANAPTGVTFTVGSGTPGVINLGWFDATGSTPISIASGKLVDLNFTYKKGTSAIGFTTSACDIANGSGTSITGIVYQNGSLLSSTTTTLTISTVQAPAAGGAVTMPIVVSNFTNVGAITLKITYDTSAVTYVGVANAPIGVTFTVGSGTPGVINLGWFDATGSTPISIASGKLVDLNFTYKKGTSAIGFTTSACDIANGSGTSITGIVYQNGSLIPSVVPGVPVLRTPTTGATNQPVSLTLTWDSVAGATTYTVQVGTDSLFANVVINDSTLTTASKQVSALLISTKYYWRVNAKNAGGTSSYSTVFNFTTIIIAVPVAPVLQTPATGATNQPVSLTLTWGSVTGAATYRAQVATDSLFAAIIVNDSTLTTNSKAISGLLNSTKYYWRVNAKNTGGTSSYSTVFNFTTVPASPLSPVLQTPATGTTNQPVSLTLTWGSVTGAATYRVQVATDSLFANVVVDDSTLMTGSKQVSGLLNSTKYYWRVSAKNASGTSSYSTVFNFTTIVAVAGTPVLQTPATGATNQPVSLTLTWGSMTGAATYRVQVATDNLFTALVVDDSTLTTNSKSISGLLNSTKYYWRVSAKNTGGTSNYSTVNNFTTIIAVPGAPVLQTPATGATNQPATLTLTWNSVTGAATYRVQVATDNLFTALVVDDSTLTTTSKQVGPLTLNTQYYWRVNAKNAGGTSSYSTVFSFRVIATDVETPGELPKEFSLSQNYPNPFNPTTSIKFGLPVQAPVTMEIYNILGVKVRTLLRGEVMSAGLHQMEWNGKDDAGVSVTSGVYLYRINAGTFQVTKKMMMLK
jgi:hypothetical protein